MTMETMTEQELEYQKKQFLNEIDRSFTERYEILKEFNDEAIPVKVVVRTREEIDIFQILQLQDTGKSYGLKMTFSATDTGRLSINFKSDQN